MKSIYFVLGVRQYSGSSIDYIIADDPLNFSVESISQTMALDNLIESDCPEPLEVLTYTPLECVLGGTDIMAFANGKVKEYTTIQSTIQFTTPAASCTINNCPQLAVVRTGNTYWEGGESTCSQEIVFEVRLDAKYWFMGLQIQGVDSDYDPLLYTIWYKYDAANTEWIPYKNQQIFATGLDATKSEHSLQTLWAFVAQNIQIRFQQYNGKFSDKKCQIRLRTELNLREFKRLDLGLESFKTGLATLSSPLGIVNDNYHLGKGFINDGFVLYTQYNNIDSSNQFDVNGQCPNSYVLWEFDKTYIANAIQLQGSKVSADENYHQRFSISYQIDGQTNFTQYRDLDGETIFYTGHFQQYQEEDNRLNTFIFQKPFKAKRVRVKFEPFVGEQKVNSETTRPCLITIRFEILVARYIDETGTQPNCQDDTVHYLGGGQLEQPQWVPDTAKGSPLGITTDGKGLQAQVQSYAQFKIQFRCASLQTYSAIKITGIYPSQTFSGTVGTPNLSTTPFLKSDYVDIFYKLTFEEIKLIYGGMRTPQDALNFEVALSIKEVNSSIESTTGLFISNMNKIYIKPSELHASSYTFSGIPSLSPSSQFHATVTPIVCEVDLQNATKTYTYNVGQASTINIEDIVIEFNQPKSCAIFGSQNGHLYIDPQVDILPARQATVSTSVVQVIEKAKFLLPNTAPFQINFEVKYRLWRANDASVTLNSLAPYLVNFDLQVVSCKEYLEPLIIDLDIDFGVTKYASLTSLLPSEYSVCTPSEAQISDGNTLVSAQDGYLYVNSEKGQHDQKIQFNLTGTTFSGQISRKVQITFKCGREKIKNLKQNLELEMVLGVAPKIEEIPLTGMQTSTIENCKIESYWLGKNQKADPIGKNFLTVSQNSILVDKSKALSGLHEFYLFSRTIGGVSGSSIRFKLNLIENDIVNKPPHFTKDLENISIKVREQDQIEKTQIVYKFESPQIIDEEGDQFYFSVEGFEQIKGVSIIQKDSSFETKIDDSLITSNETGNHSITVTLGDYGKIPKFEQKVNFFINIEYTSMNESDKTQVIKDKELDDIFQIEEKPGETVQERKQRTKQLRDQFLKIGYTFPGVSDDQIRQIIPHIEPPTVKISSISSLGVLTLKFNEPMYYPMKYEEYDYSKVFSLDMISPRSNSSGVSGVQIKSVTKRRLSILEVMDYYSTIDYHDDHNIDEYVLKRENQESKQKVVDEDQVSISKQTNQFSWEVTNHTSTELTIQLKFSDPALVSSTTFGRDNLELEIKDRDIFKSQLSGKPIQFGNENLKMLKSLPPQINDAQLVESIQESTDLIQLATNYLSQTSFLVGILLGGSMQQLYGLIRSMQLIVLQMVMDIPFPSHAFLFFQGAILFANMDILSGEDFYAAHFTFQETDPINERFDEFGIGDKNFVNNSGSYLIMQVYIIVWYILKYLMHRLSIRFARYSIFRYIGMQIGQPDSQEIKQATLRLLLESYIDISMSVLINIYAFFESGQLFMSTFQDSICSMLTILLFIAVIAFPVFIVYKIRKDPEFIANEDWLFTGLRAADYEVSLYQAYFMMRRLILVVILTIFHKRILLQCWIQILLSMMNLIYLIKNHPFTKRGEQRIEVFNESCILLSTIMTFTLVDPANSTEFRSQTGWSLIGLVTINIAVNFILVIYSVSSQIYLSLEELYLTIINYIDKYNFIESKYLSQEEKDQLKKEIDDINFCREWAKSRKWLAENSINFSKFEDEIKFQELIVEHSYKERAQQIQIIMAQERMAQKLKIMDVQRELKAKKQKQKKKKDLQQKEIKIDNLSVIMEENESLEVQSIEHYLEKIDQKAIFGGLNQGVQVDLFEKIDRNKPQSDLNNYKFLNLDFAIENPAKVSKKLEEEFLTKFNTTREQRWEEEFSQNLGLIILKDERQLYQGKRPPKTIENVLHCLLSLDHFVSHFILSSHDSAIPLNLQKLLIQVFQSHSQFQFNTLHISFFTRLFDSNISPEDFMDKLNYPFDVVFEEKSGYQAFGYIYQDEAYAKRKGSWYYFGGQKVVEMKRKQVEPKGLVFYGREEAKSEEKSDDEIENEDSY